MRGYVTLPASISCAVCKECGAKPIIAMAEGGEYVVRCPNSDTHYHTDPGLIDIEDWNQHNIPAEPKRLNNQPDHFFFLNGTITPAGSDE